MLALRLPFYFEKMWLDQVIKVQVRLGRIRDRLERFFLQPGRRIMNDDDAMSKESSTRSNLTEEQLKQAALVALQEKRQFNAQAQQCMQQAKRYWSETTRQGCYQACKAERRAKRLRVDADEAQKLHDSLQFDALCLALRRNDPATTELPCDSVFPNGYARRLGEALRNNTHVSKVEIQARKLVLSTRDAKEVLSFIAPFLSFLRSCESLRSISMSFKALYFSAGKCLENEIMQSLIAIEGEIEQITISPCVDIALLCHGMHSWSALKTLDIHIGMDSSRDEQNAIEEAFHSCTASLKSLRVDTVNDLWIRCILRGLLRSDCKLCELKLSCLIPCNEFWIALSEFAHSSTLLKHLQIEKLGCKKEQMEFLLQCLYGQSSIAKLSFVNCLMDFETMCPLKRFMRTRKENNNLRVSSLRELVFEDCAILYLPRAKGWTRSSFVSMFWADPKVEKGQLRSSYGERSSTIGSRIHSLTMGPVCDCNGAGLGALARNAHRVKLVCLSLYWLDAKDCKHLARYICKASSIRELTLDEIKDQHSILRSLRINGTLHRVTIPGEIESRLANSFCLRNQQLHHMSLKLTVTASDQSDNTVERTQCPLVLDRDAIPLLPTLLQCAKQISAVHASIVLTSLFLLNHGESL
jgi:hypothetical protein